VYVTEASAGVSPISTCQTIMSSGSYELTQNLNHDGTNPPNGCLEVDADNVTIRDFGAGISLGGDRCRIEWIIAFSNGNDGIVLGAGHCDVNNNIANNNGDDGIVTENDSTIKNNIANDNVTDGIEAGPNNNIIYNTANGNGTGINVVCPSNLVGNIAQNNGTKLNQFGAGCKRYNNLF